MKTFIGIILSVLVEITSMLRKLFLFIITMAMFMGVMIFTVLALFDLIMSEHFWGIKWYWDIIIFVCGSGMFILTMKRLNTKTNELEKRY